MIIKKLFLITLLCSAPLISAAADTSPDVFIFYTDQIEGKKRLVPGLHCINRNCQEAFSGKTFKELFPINACEKNIPWLLTVGLIKTVDEKSIVHYFDLLEFLKMQNRTYHSNDFATRETTIQTIQKVLMGEPALLRVWFKHYPKIKSLAYDVSCLYYASERTKDFENSNQSPTKDFSFEGHNTISDLSCSLAIALCNDYSQLLPIIGTLTRHEARLLLHELDQRDFWCETFLALPEEQQEILHKECKARFGWDVAVSRNQANS